MTFENAPVCNAQAVRLLYSRAGTYRKTIAIRRPCRKKSKNVRTKRAVRALGPERYLF